MRVLVTGASGFLGRELTRALVARGCSVRGLVRSTGSDLPAGVEPVFASSYDDPTPIEMAVRGMDVIVHLAGRAHVGGRAALDVQAFRGANVDTTKALLAAADAAGVRLFVYLSSMAVFGDASHVALDEEAVPDPHTAYGLTKLEAERLVRSAAHRSGRAAVIVRPPMVYGPGMKGNPLRLFRWISAGRPLPFGALHNRRSVLYSGNLIAALTRIIEGTETEIELFHVADANPVSTRELVQCIAAALDRSARLIPIPPALLAWAGRLLSAVPEGLRFGAGGTDLRRAMQDFVVDARRINRRLGFELPFATPEGIALTAQWFRGPHEPSDPGMSS